MKIFYASIGLIIGYLIPWLSQKIMEYKNKIIGTEKNQKLYILKRIVMSLFNGVVWYYTYSNIDNIIIAILISIQITIAIMFTYIDIKVRLIPNELVLTLLIVGILYQAINGIEAILGSVMSMIFIMIVFTAVAGFMGFGKVGAGDVKLAGAIGFALGYPAITTAMGAMAIILIIFILLGLTLKKIQLKSMLPLAPFLSAGYILTLLYYI